MANGEGVTYTVKELLTQLDKTLSDQMGGITRRLDSISEKLDEKASNHRVDAMEKHFGETIADLAGRIGRLELASAGSEAVTRFQRWALGTVGVGCLGAIATLVWLASGGH